MTYRRACAEVDARDGHRCRVCRQWTLFGHHHHIVYRSRGGADTTGNLIRICGECHAAIHSGKVRVSGDGNGRLLIQSQEGL